MKLGLRILFFSLLVGWSGCASVPSSTAFQGADLGVVPAPDPQLSLKTDRSDWYKDQNFYHIWVSAFADSDGNGLGDIPGITSKLDYLKDLGATALWLSPFCKSASGNGNLHGYDTVDFSLVDPRLGTNEDMKTLVREAHKRGLRIIFDMVPNHVSNKHPWFIASQKGDPAKRNWFLWKNEIPEFGWENWGGQSAWREGGEDPQGQEQFYYGLFWSGMPDLNYRNPEVRRAIAQAAAFWLDQGFDGIRMDAVRFLVENLENGDNGVNKIQPETVEFFQDFQAQVLKAYGEKGYAKFMVAENWTNQKESLKMFFGTKDRPGFEMTMDFPFGALAYQVATLGIGAWEGPQGLKNYWNWVAGELTSAGGWMGTFLTNHDNYQSRPYTAFSEDQTKINLAVVLQYTGLGTPFWFYGNELDMTGVNRGDDREFRKPTLWENLPQVQAKPQGTYRTAQTLMKLRQDRVSLRRGDFLALDPTPKGLKAYQRTFQGEKTLVLMNLAEEPLSGPLAVEATKARVLWGPEKALKLETGTLKVTNLGAHEALVIALE